MILQYIVWNVNPEILPLGPLSLRYYGILFAAAFFFGYLLFKKIFEKEGYSIEMLDQLTIYMALGTIIGARLGHVLFYDPGYYFSNPLKIIAIWEGGLASHGAAIGILTALYLFIRKNKLSYLWILDRIALVIALSGVCIRLGNLMNSEIYGIPTTMPWGFLFVRSSEVVHGIETLVPRHPTQIYEALSYLAIFIFTFVSYFKGYLIKQKGKLFGIFLILLFGARFLIEYIKNSQEDFEKALPFDMGQILSIPFILVGIFLIINANRNKTREKAEIKV
jgi:prolipoprotein diacylglyceryl transferase